MSKKGQQKESKSPIGDGGGSGPPASAVDFLFRTMIERESAPGKRRIRPKNVEELLQSDIQELGSDEDPDFEVSKDKHHNESDVSINSDEDDSDANDASGGKGGGDDDSDEDDDSYDANFDEDASSVDSSNNGRNSSEEDSSEEDGSASPSPVQKKSALRETLQKLNDTDFTPQRKKRRRKPKKPVGASAAASNGKGKLSAASKKSETATNLKKKSKVLSKSKAGGDSKLRSEESKTGKSASSGISKKRKRVITSKNRIKVKEELRSKRKRKKSEYRSITDLVASAEKSQQENRKEIDLGNPICSACLGSKSDGSNEVVECDSCGISVHEACYGVSDTLSVSSGSGSSCSTEPWFCDACKTGAKSISCELCPIKGGLFKETSFGRWVHLVCGLYTRQVVHDENGLLSLLGIPYTKWGSHPCSVCEDDRYTRTGICIPCDAGMCKAYLHVTCAQSHGLLSDPVPENPGAADTAEADPYYAACKLHTNRETAKRRAKSYGILQEQLRVKREKKLSETLSPKERHDQIRILRKLERIRFKVAIKQAHSYSPHPLKSFPLGACGSNSTSLATITSVPGGNSREEQKKSRLLSTSAGVTRKFLHKAEMMGCDLKSLELEDRNTRIVANVKRKWNVLPSLGVEFAAYYADREIRINKMSEQCEKLEKENNELNDVQISLQCSYDTQFVNHQAMYEDTGIVRNQLIGLSEVVKELCPYGNKKLSTTLTGFVRTDLPGMRRRSPSHSTKGVRASPPKSSGLKKNKRSKLSSSPTTAPGRLAIANCFICKKSDDQHLITRCDHCKKHYHLRCLDPPLSRMPKRSRLCGWMCSDCGEEEPEVEEAQVDTEAPRSLRGRTKIRKPGKYRHSCESDDDLKILHETQKTDTTPTSTQVSIALTEIKMEPEATKILTNGNIKSSKRRRSGSNSTTSAKSVSVSLSSPPVMSSGMPTPEVNLQTKKEPLVNPFKTPSPLKSPVDKISPEQKKQKSKKPKKVQEISELTQPKIKKERKRKEKKPTDLVNSAIPSAEKEIVKMNNKIKGGANSTTKEKKATISNSTPSKKSKDVNTPPVKKPKDTPRKKSEGEPKKKRKSRAKVQKVVDGPSGSTAGTDIANMPNNNDVFALGVVSPNKNETIVNGIPKAAPVKKRKSSGISSASPSVGSSPPEKEKSMPPKKRKRIKSTPQIIPINNANMCAVIDAVAIGFQSDMGDKNGMTRNTDPSLGVIMQGIAPNQNQWINKGEGDHNLLKGHGMGSNCRGDEIVTVNASDLFDYVANTTSASVTSYSPGFYSSPSATTSLNYVSSPLSQIPPVKYNNPKDALNSTVGLPMSSPWTQPQESQNQNVIKLHYESDSVVSVAPYSAMASSYTPPPAVSSIDGKCASCKKEDSKKFMVTCDKCAQDFHFMCLTPPLKYSPRRRGYSWYCSGCDDDSSAASGQENGINSP